MGIRKCITLTISMILLWPATANAAHHSHYWHKTHPWFGTDWKQKALCVHRYEGSWDAVSRTIPTYYGGMQMDENFMHAYGPWMRHHFGTANHWPRNGQLYASWKAWRVRGWQPWPTTARMCGLL